MVAYCLFRKRLMIMPKSLVILVLFLLVGCAGVPNDHVEIVESDAATVDPAQDIATEFQSLRIVRGHFLPPAVRHACFQFYRISGPAFQYPQHAGTF